MTHSFPTRRSSDLARPAPPARQARSPDPRPPGTASAQTRHGSPGTARRSPCGAGTRSPGSGPSRSSLHPADVERALACAPACEERAVLSLARVVVPADSVLLAEEIGRAHVCTPVTTAHLV